MMPVRRDVRIALPAERIADWHEAGPATTAFINAMSVLFPAGERFFMDAVRHYRDEIVDPELKREIAGFIGQEAMHSREHVEYNDLIEAAGMPADQLDQWLWKFLGNVRKFGGPKLALAITIALEHFTAMFAGAVFNDPAMIGGERAFQQMWTWHVFEEAEHKSVSFDVWNAVMKPNLINYLTRTGTMAGATVMFWGIQAYFTREVLRGYRRNVGKVGVFNYLRLGNRLFGPTRGLVPKIWRQYLDFYKPGFHPRDHDITIALEQFEALFGNISAVNQLHAPDLRSRRVPLHPGAQAVLA